MLLKHDGKDIKEYMAGVSDSLGLEANRAWWTNFLFRSDHVENAAAILNRGELLSRSTAEKEQLIIKDSGSPEHISQLDKTQRNLVRLYFRPRTPTNYANEGFRPSEFVEYGAHMPIPVYLLFTSRLLSQQGVQFSKGRLTPQSEIGHTVDFLRQMNFAHIYHDGSFGVSERSSILNARHSEVLVQDKLNLDPLKHIVCRSSPERETLLSLLNPEARRKWVKYIHIDEGHRRLFEKRGIFVKNVHLESNKSIFTFYTNIESHMRGPYQFCANWLMPDGTGLYNKEIVNYTVPNYPVRFRLPKQQKNYIVKLTLNEDLAYFGRFNDKEAHMKVF